MRLPVKVFVDEVDSGKYSKHVGMEINNVEVLAVRVAKGVYPDLSWYNAAIGASDRRC